MIIFSKINLSQLKKMSLPLYIFSLLLLFLVFVPGIGIKIWGARRWLSLGGYSIQPSEFTKFTLLLYLSSLFSQEEKRTLKNLLFIALPAFFLIVLEPDFGTASIIVALCLVIYFISGASIKNLLSLSLLTTILGIFFILFSPYRRKRIIGLLDPFYDPLGDSYHVYQIVLTLSAGGFFGRGIGESRQKYQYLPQVTTDSIMAVVGEELGFLGLTIFTGLLIFLVWLCFKIAKSKENLFAKLIAVGTGSWIATQGLVNLSSIAIILPLTGVPFPFISYGGSSLLAIMAAIGLVLNVNKNCK